jgi:hypothetical protein
MMAILKIILHINALVLHDGDFEDNFRFAKALVLHGE